MTANYYNRTISILRSSLPSVYLCSLKLNVGPNTFYFFINDGGGGLRSAVRFLNIIV